MTESSETAQWLTWLRVGEARFLNELERLPEEEIRADSALPGWSRAHVAAHVARNAEAVSRLLSWARTGTETQMYPDMESRNRGIEASADQDAAALRGDVRRTSAQFEADIAALPPAAWSTRVRTFQGRDLAATSVIWMRVREVWLHLVDLDTNTLVDSWPGDLVDALLDDVTATMTARADAPTIRLQATDRDRGWQIGTDSNMDSREVAGTASDILAWLTGRSKGQGLATEGTLPSLPHWM